MLISCHLPQIQIAVIQIRTLSIPPTVALVLLIFSSLIKEDRRLLCFYDAVLSEQSCAIFARDFTYNSHL